MWYILYTKIVAIGRRKRELYFSPLFTEDLENIFIFGTNLLIFFLYSALKKLMLFSLLFLFCYFQCCYFYCCLLLLVLVLLLYWFKLLFILMLLLLFLLSMLLMFKILFLVFYCSYKVGCYLSFYLAIPLIISAEMMR